MASLFFITCPYHVGFTKKIPHLKGFEFQTNLNLLFFSYLPHPLREG